ncbi:magnesium transporter CorA family protein [Candidatus Nomurabacteria bacterium]|nr:magnesium transporter CorA family protein [Candidatus Nomurabacteria bacterium]
MAIKIIEENQLKWINIDSVDDEALAYLRENFNFHHLDIDDIQSESQTPKIDIYKNYLFIVLQFPQWRADKQMVVDSEVDIFIGENFLITIQHNKVRELKNFFYKCLKNKNTKRKWMSHDSGFLLYKLIDSLFHECRPLLNNMGRQIAKIENEIFDGTSDPAIVKRLAVLRRNVLNFRRIIDPQRYLMSNLSHTRKPFLNEDTSLYFDDINDYLSKLWAILERYKDTINGLHVTVESLINQKTNQVISALTVISVSLLPLTLLSGIYGMNIDGLPFAHSPFFVWAMFVALALIIIMLIIIMRKRKYL